MSEVTEKNTKKQILDAYQSALEKLKKTKSDRLDPKEERVQQRENEVRESTNPEKVEGTVTELEYLASSIPTTLQHYVKDLRARSLKVQELDEAISSCSQELERLYGISSQADSLVALVNSHKQLKADLELEMTEARRSWGEKIEDLKKDHARKEITLKQDYDRQVESWEYDYARERKRKEDSLADELKAEERVFNEGLTMKRKELSEERDILEKREFELSQREAKQADLESAVEDLKTGQDQAVEEAVNKGKEKARVSYAIEVNALKKTHEAEVTVLKGKVEQLVGQVESLTKENGLLSTKLNEAYAKIQDVALKSLESQGNARMVELSRSMAIEPSRSKS